MKKSSKIERKPVPSHGRKGTAIKSKARTAKAEPSSTDEQPSKTKSKTKPKTVRMLLDAIDRLVAGEPRVSDGRFTQDNIALEAGVSRATFNRCPEALEEYQRVRALRESGEESGEEIKPFTIEDKNRSLQESISQVRSEAANAKKEYERHIAAARQEIYVLNGLLKKREEIIAIRDKDIASLKKQLAQAEKSTSGRLKIVK